MRTSLIVIGLIVLTAACGEVAGQEPAASDAGFDAACCETFVVAPCDLCGTPYDAGADAGCQGGDQYDAACWPDNTSTGLGGADAGDHG